jgi:hypothetical protein
MTRTLRYTSGAALVVALVCVALSFHRGSLGLGIAAAVAFVLAAVAGGAAFMAAPPSSEQRAPARTAMLVALGVLAAALLYFLIGLHNLGD